MEDREVLDIFDSIGKRSIVGFRPTYARAAAPKMGHWMPEVTTLSQKPLKEHLRDCRRHTFMFENGREPSQEEEESPSFYALLQGGPLREAIEDHYREVNRVLITGGDVAILALNSHPDLLRRYQKRLVPKGSGVALRKPHEVAQVVAKAPRRAARIA